ncbi:MAG: ParB/RepB/Spo0J family partition protein [bacterium]
MKMALGRGLDALIPERGIEVIALDIKKIVPNPDQPRKTFKDSSLKELAQSIKSKGVLQPIVVSQNNDGSYSIIAGERRWRAAAFAGLDKIPAFIKKVDQKDSLEIALIENIQREDLNPLEMASAFNYLLSTYNLTQEELSEKVGKDRATVANYLRLLKLPDEIKRLLNEEKLTMGHARAIAGIEQRQKQIDVARAIVSNSLNVRQVEHHIRNFDKQRPQKKTASRVDPNIRDIEDKLRKHLGTKVKILHKGKKGKIEIEYYSLEELDRLLDIIF